MIKKEKYDIIYEWENHQAEPSPVTVLITCYRYGHLIHEALNSLLNQTEKHFSIIIIDDCSPDDSTQLISTWLQEKNHLFIGQLHSIRFIRHRKNHGVSQARNTALSLIKSSFTFILDADNMLYPRALTEFKNALLHSNADAAYSLIECFGATQAIVNNTLWVGEQLLYGNYIDAMALIKTDALNKIGGYHTMPYQFGWEDYDLWCSMISHQFHFVHIPQILCRYRVSPTSMLRSKTNIFVSENHKFINRYFSDRHHRQFHLQPITIPNHKSTIRRKLFSHYIYIKYRLFNFGWLNNR